MNKGFKEFVLILFSPPFLTFFADNKANLEKSAWE